MKIKLKILMAVLAVFFLFAGNAFAIPINVTYTVSGGAGNYFLTFNVDEYFAISKAIVVFAVDVGTPVSAPDGWTLASNASYLSRWVNSASPLGDVSGFVVSVSTVPIDGTVNYVAFTQNAARTTPKRRTGIAYDPPNPDAKIPEPATLLLLGLGLLGLAGIKRKK